VADGEVTEAIACRLTDAREQLRKKGCDNGKGRPRTRGVTMVMAPSAPMGLAGM
jgi:hypothetical protein